MSKEQPSSFQEAREDINRRLAAGDFAGYADQKVTSHDESWAYVKDEQGRKHRLGAEDAKKAAEAAYIEEHEGLNIAYGENPDQQNTTSLLDRMRTESKTDLLNDDSIDTELIRDAMGVSFTKWHNEVNSLSGFIDKVRTGDEGAISALEKVGMGVSDRVEDANTDENSEDTTSQSDRERIIADRIAKRESDKAAREAKVTDSSTTMPDTSAGLPRTAADGGNPNDPSPYATFRDKLIAQREANRAEGRSDDDDAAVVASGKTSPITDSDPRIAVKRSATPGELPDSQVEDTDGSDETGAADSEAVASQTETSEDMGLVGGLFSFVKRRVKEDINGVRQAIQARRSRTAETESSTPVMTANERYSRRNRIAAAVSGLALFGAMFGGAIANSSSTESAPAQTETTTDAADEGEERSGALGDEAIAALTGSSGTAETDKESEATTDSFDDTAAVEALTGAAASTETDSSNDVIATITIPENDPTNDNVWNEVEAAVAGGYMTDDDPRQAIVAQLVNQGMRPVISDIDNVQPGQQLEITQQMLDNAGLTAADLDLAA